MALVNITVVQRKEGSIASAKSFASEVQVIDTGRVIYATPSICKDGNGFNSLVRSKLKVAGTAGDPSSTVTFYCTETVAAIKALT